MPILRVMKNARRIWIVCAVVMLSLSATVPELAASELGVVAGTVADNVGGPLPGARVEIAGPSRTPAEKSGGMGFFFFTGLAAGEYTVTVSHPQFASVMQRVLVRPGQTTTINVQLLGAR
jgi:hypothetical protein